MRSVLVLSLVLFAFGCTHPAGSADAPPAESAATAPAPENERAIAAFVTREAKVTLVSGEGKELRVVVRKLDGTLVADHITVDELAVRDPALHAIVESAVASKPNGTYLDARGYRPTKRN